MRERHSLVDIAFDRIKEHIEKNNYEPNDKYLSEKELIDRLQVSRTVIREALVRLQSIGLIHIVTGSGIYIANKDADPIKAILKHYGDIHPQKLKELIDIRKVIELGAIRLIIENDLFFQKEEADKLNEAYLQAIQQKGDIKEADRKFHQFLIQSTKNDTFYQFSEIIQEYFLLTNLNVIQSEASLIESYREHQHLIEGIEKKEMVEAQQVMLNHLLPIIDHIKQMEDVT